jgi:CRISPR-associated endonuclease Csn1
MENTPTNEYVLGIDLGTSSLGWAAIGVIDGEPSGLIRAGVRIFDAGMDESKGLGREESRNKARRDARLRRRQTWRRGRRLKKILGLLQRFRLLPPGDASTPAARQDLLNELDRRILASPWFAAKRASGKFPEPDHTMPYILRAAALDEPLDSHFLGRALYHLAQRRGFLSNRKQSPRRDGDDEGAVKEGIAKLRSDAEQSAARTLGEFFSHLAPSQERIRSRWTPRDMYEAEFDAIWNAQRPHHPGILTEARKKELRRAVFFQRPIWFDPNSIGKCELEPGKHRAPAHLLACQRFRLLQTVNNLRIIPPGEPETDLTPKDRQKLVDALQTNRDMTFTQVHKLLGLTKECVFNLERGGEKTIKGNRTNADFLGAIGGRWTNMSPEERNRLVEYVNAFQNPDKLSEAAQKKWGLDAEAAEKLSEISLEPDYASLSRQAIEKLLPLLETGVRYGEARKMVYHESFRAGAAAPALPPVDQALPEIRNPAVTRSLTELRKVVNAIIRQHGKPTHIRIELARELKKSKKQREAISQNNRRNESARANAVKEVVATAGITQPRPDDIRKFLLAEECGWICPYTGRSISVEALLGHDAQFEIEHIIPFSRSMDNSFQNLTLCYVDENRTVKGNRTPFEAYAGNPEKYDAVIERVRRFKGDASAAKLRRFKMNGEELATFLDEFRNRQLNDTSYASRLAANYLSTLFGGLADAEHERRIHTVSGQATYDFRRLWQLNSILNDGPTSNGGYMPKSRDDHRHHAVDAVVIGLTDASMIKRLADAAQRAPAERRRRFASLQAPWNNFVDSVRAEIDRLVVSHRVSKKVSGALHEETAYSAPGTDGAVRVRRSLSPNIKSTKQISKSEVNDIVDPRVRTLVQTKLEELGGDLRRFADEANLPRLGTKRAGQIPIKKVRIRLQKPVFRVAAPPAARYVAVDSNHHVELIATVDEDGRREDWDGRVVTMRDAYERMKKGDPVIDKTCQMGEEYRFSLSPGEVIECSREGAAPELLVYKGVSQYTAGAVVISLLPPNDARKNPKLIRVVPNRLRQWHARKVAVSPLGELREAHD